MRTRARPSQPDEVQLQRGWSAHAHSYTQAAVLPHQASSDLPQPVAQRRALQVWALQVQAQMVQTEGPRPDGEGAALTRHRRRRSLQSHITAVRPPAPGAALGDAFSSLTQRLELSAFLGPQSGRAL